MAMFNVTFTDAQGVHHTNAVVVVHHANFSDQQQRSLSRNAAGGYVNSGRGHRSVSCSARYWPSQEAFDDSRPPYSLIDATGAEIINFEPASSIDSDEALLLAVEQHLLTVVIPALQSVEA